MKKIIFSFGAVILLASFHVQPVSTNFTEKEKIASYMKSGRGFSALLSGMEEPGGGDLTGTGRAYIEFNLGQGTMYYYLEVHDIEPATAAHIHFGATGVNGPVVVGLQAPVNGISYGTIDLERALIKSIKKNPEDYYVNVHNALYPAGAVRGQITN